MSNLLALPPESDIKLHIRDAGHAMFCHACHLIDFTDYVNDWWKCPDCGSSVLSDYIQATPKKEYYFWE